MKHFWYKKGSFIPFLFCSGLAMYMSQELQAEESTEISVLKIQQNAMEVSGFVVDKFGEPIIGASVVEIGTSNGVITDLDGKFRLSVQPKSKLRISYVGYKTVEQSASSSMEIVLDEDTETLDEVVVVGYGTMKKSDLTGSVSSLQSDDLNYGVNSSFSSMLEGKAAGVRVTQSSAEPGGGVDVQIRGAGSVNASSTPLYVIDGLPIETSSVVSGMGSGMPASQVARNPLSNINPSDIESMEILKDASATAIYGARGANGVVLITTKKGKQGKPVISYNAYLAVQSPKDMVDVLCAEDYKRILNEIQATPGSNVADSEIVQEIQGGGTNWQDELIQTSLVNSHGLSVNGGSDKIKYFSSINFFNQEGVIKTSGYKRIDGRLNLEYKGDNLSLGMNMSTSYSHDDIVPLGYSTNEQGGVLYSASRFDPTLSIYDDEGEYNVSTLLNIDNPLALLYGKTSETSNYRTLGTTYFDYKILKGWNVKLNVGFDIRNSRRDSYVSQLTKDGKANSGIASIFTGTRSNYLGELTSTYNHSFDNGNTLNLMVGTTFQKFMSSSFSGSASGFPVDNLETNNMGMGDPSRYTMSSGRENNKLLSYIGRINYNLFNKFLLTATMRIDGSSRFGKNNKYGYFPSAAFAWKLHEHKFIKNLNVFDVLKFRTSYGVTGNQDIGNYLSITTYGKGGYLILDDKQSIGFEPLRIANPDLKWETTSQFNVGLDFGFFNNRLNFTTEYFLKKTYDMLFNKPIPTSTGFSSIMQNVGSIKNSGFELSVQSYNFVGDFSWITNFNLSTLRNRVLDLGGIPEMIHTNAGQSTSQIAIIREGEPINSFFGYKTDGIWQTQEEIIQSGTKDNVKPGDVKFVDQNNDGFVNTEDRVIIGKSIPSLTWGLGNELSYKNLSINFFIDAAHGFSILNNALVETYYPVSHRRNRLAEPLLNRWTPDNPTNKYPSFVNPAGQGAKAVSDLTVEDGSYVRLQTVQINYNVPIKKNKFISKLGLYVTGQNLLTLTGYSGQDPAFNSYGNSTLRIDFNSYPTYRTYTFGVEITF